MPTVCFFIATNAAAQQSDTAKPTEITPAGDNIDIKSDARIKPGRYLIRDLNDSGVIRIKADNVTVDFQGAELRGAKAGRSSDTYLGKGVIVTGKNVTLKNARISGFKVGVFAKHADGLKLQNIDVSDNFRKRLHSTPRAEHEDDWLRPQDNNKHQWMLFYGAGVYVEESRDVTIQGVTARDVQNGIIFDNVHESKVCDCDCSFLSGWGLALWRSNKNLISRNAFDFCVRGYSHGVYNRGQDSAGILMFEQCSDNVISENSATHCGDGLFAFGGEESLAGAGKTGCNNNLIIGNDFSYAAAHGLEITFSIGNRIIANRFAGNAICGIWAGYSQQTQIAGNSFESNGDAGYGLERGGVNIEHGSGNRIEHNRFVGNTCGVHLWTDEDPDLASTPWVQANVKGSTDNVIAHNVFKGDTIGVHLRAAKQTRMLANAFDDVAKQIDADADSTPEHTDGPAVSWKAPDAPTCGKNNPTSARKLLAGRDHIHLTEWGPYDYRTHALIPTVAYGPPPLRVWALTPGGGSLSVKKVDGKVDIMPKFADLPHTLAISAGGEGIEPFTIHLDVAGRDMQIRGAVINAKWRVRYFAWQPDKDPRDGDDNWREIISQTPLAETAEREIAFNWPAKSPADGVPADYFATVAETRLHIPAGRWALRTVSDDGIRVWVDDELVINDWTWHAAKAVSASVKLESGDHAIRVEHFEINGAATLQLAIEPAQ